MFADRLKNNINIPILLLWVVGIGFFFCGMPKYIDDFWYLENFRPWFEAQGIDRPENGGNIFTAGFPAESFYETLIYRYNTDNIRLGNILATLFLLFPKWLGSGIMTILFGWCAILIMKICGLNWRKSPALPALLFLLTFCLPLHDQFGSLVFQFNYILPAWLTLLLYYKLKNGKGNPVNALITFIIGFVLGVTHEGFSVPVAVGLCSIFVLYRTWRCTDVMLSIIGLTAGFVILLSIPPVMNVITDTDALPISYIVKASLAYLITETPAFFIMLLCWIITLIRLNPREVLREALFPFIFFSSATLAPIIMRSFAEIRAAFWIDLGAAMGITRLLCLNFPNLFRRYKAPTSVLSAILLAVTYIHLGYVGRYSLEIRSQRSALEREFLNDPARYINKPYMFGKVTGSYEMSAWACGRPTQNAPVRILDREIDFYMHRDSLMPHLPVIPEELRLADTRRSHRMGAESYVYEKDGFFFTPLKFAPSDSLELMAKIKVIIEDGSKSVMADARTVPFKSEADHREYSWLYFEDGRIPKGLQRNLKSVITISTRSGNSEK